MAEDLKATLKALLDSSNTTPTMYWDEVNFKSDLPFHLDYVGGSALINNIVLDRNDNPTGEIKRTYNPGANAIIRFYAEVVDDDFTCGKFILRNWSRATVGTSVVQDSADVNVQLAYCPDPEEPNPVILVGPEKKINRFSCSRKYKFI